MTFASHVGDFNIFTYSGGVNYTEDPANRGMGATAYNLNPVVPQGGGINPVANNDYAAATQNTPVTLTVLANDYSPEAYPLTVTAVSGYMGPLQGTALINADNTITYTPPSGFSGTAWLSYTVSDGQGGTAEATITITVSA